MERGAGGGGNPVCFIRSERRESGSGGCWQVKRGGPVASQGPDGTCIIYNHPRSGIGRGLCKVYLVMTFVEITTVDGGSVFVNPYQVVRVERDTVDGRTRVEMASGKVVYTTTAQATVESALEAGL